VQINANKWHLKGLFRQWWKKKRQENILRVYKTIILPVVVYRCETWSLILSEEHRLRVFENRVLRDEVTGGWRKLHNQELHKLYFSPNIIRMIEE
jgi:hypothetical protein